VRQLAIVALVLTCGLGPAGAEPQSNQAESLILMRRTRQEQRLRAALKALDRRKKNEDSGRVSKQRKWAPDVGPSSSQAPGGGGSGVKGAAATLLRMMLAQVGTPDLYASPNYATSKLPVAHCSTSTATLCQKDSDCPGYAPPVITGGQQLPGGETCTGPVVAGTGIRKFVDSFAGLCPMGPNNLGNCIPLASPDTTTYPGSDYYELGLRDYVQQFHSDLPNKTRLRGYYQKNPNPATTQLYDPRAAQNAYLGPFILAYSYRPVRVKFFNELGVTGDNTTGPGAHGELFLPVDTSVSGSGLGPDGLPYAQNRATLHLHGGNTPWISDGTQHQWTLPAGETNSHKKGVSAEDVPDMPPAGDGALTFYWPNEQSGRMMYFHDHSYGITRLNVYAGEVGGYLLANKPDEDALAAASVPGTLGTTRDLMHFIPLIIQDKTFVPPAAQLAAQDPTWDTARWGGEDALWFPHVYMPNQWPGNPDLSNVNPFGRWDYGPWFTPQPLTSLTEVNYLGAVVNRPLTQPCTSIAAVTATNTAGSTLCPSLPVPSLVPEAYMDTPVINGVAYPTMNVEPAAYRFQILNGSNDHFFSLSFFVADASGTEVTMVPADVHTATSAVPLCSAAAPVNAATGLPAGCWPTTWPSDGRQGGVPDPATAGPQWVQIGNESGILPAPALIPPTPVSYDQTTGKAVLNVTTKGLFMAPAERADVVVDFSAFAGKTLILYNDSAAPTPVGDPRLDYFTGAPDLTLTGGAPTPLPGYGPNIRTVMQIKVASARTTPQVAFNITSAAAALKQRFAVSQPVPVVPEAVYSGMYGPSASYSNTYLPLTQVLPVSVTPIGQTTPMSIPVPNKALVELFSTSYGRANSLLGVESPLASWATQTSIPFASFDPPTEFIEDNKPQIWRITHNGVDTHLIHFHLLNVQILNRVGWDGVIRPPDANELGWKESVRMNPLEDIFVALQPVRQNLPWPQPDKWRPLDVDRALNTATSFTALDVHNNPVVVSNQMTNFGQEYVWHCHLLGHEDEDMLRAEVFVVAPETPTTLAAAGAGLTSPPVTLSWQDASKSAMAFNVQRATDALFTAGLTTFQVKAPGIGPGPVSFVDSTAAAGTTYYYRVQASKSLSSPAFVGSDQGSAVNPYIATSGWSNATTFPGPLPVVSASVVALDFGNQPVGTTSAAQVVALANTGTAPLSLLSVAAAGEFAVASTCGTSLAAGASCSLSVTFAPTSAGAKTADLAINTNAAASPLIHVALTGTGTAPGLSIAGATSFGDVLLNTTATASVTLTNGGTAPATGLAISVAGAATFGQTNTCGTSLAAGASCSIALTFAPTAAGAQSATLSISANAPAAPLSAALTGAGVAPLAKVSPASLTFGPQGLATTSPAQAVTVSNAGITPLTITGFAIAGAEFAQTNNCASPLAAGASCTVNVTYTPTSLGTASSTLTVNVGAPATAQTVALSGTGTLNVSPGSLAFGAQLVGTVSAISSVTLRNGSASPVTGIAPIIAGADFTFTTSCGTLSPGASCAIDVRFAPTAAGPRNAILIIPFSGTGSPAAVALSGTGNAPVPAPVLQVSPTSLALASALNVQSAPSTVTVANTGNAPLTLSSIALANDASGAFALTNKCVSPLAAGASCTVSVTFRPTAATSPQTANLNVTVAAPAASQSVALTGTVASPALTLAPTSVNFGAVTRGRAGAPVAITVSNSGGAGSALIINSIALNTGDSDQFSATNVNCPIGGAGLAAGASCRVNVVFQPTAKTERGTKTSTLSVSVASPATAQSVALTGTAQ
jgi:FtsP/CotA-like multicopper oxidase with cupredoxin domain